jgi:hypothetical protein
MYNSFSTEFLIFDEHPILNHQHQEFTNKKFRVLFLIVHP